MSSRIRSLTVGALLLGGLFTVTGCGAVDGLIPGAEPVAGESADPAAGPAEVTDVFSLGVGDCVNVLGGDLTGEVIAVPCSTSHDWEVYFEPSLDDPEFPGEDALVAAAEEGCGGQFAQFLGLDPDAAAGSALGFTYLTPTETDWSAADDHAIECLIGDMSGPVTGSLSGTLSGMTR